MTDRHPLDGNMIAADRHYGDAPVPHVCPSCGGELHAGADPDEDWCSACDAAYKALESCAYKAQSLARLLQAAYRNAGYPDIKQRDFNLRIAHNTLEEIKEALPSHE